MTKISTTETQRIVAKNMFWLAERFIGLSPYKSRQRVYLALAGMSRDLDGELPRSAQELVEDGDFLAAATMIDRIADGESGLFAKKLRRNAAALRDIA